MASDKKRIAELMKTDLYGLFELTSEASEKEIKSAYRKMALKCHPDKNPDNPKAVLLFQQLTDALEVLTDALTRATYDKLLKAKENADLRTRELDAKRRKLKEDLDERERLAGERRLSPADLERQLQNEIERLRKEGSKILEEENRRMKEKLQQELSRVQEETTQEILCPRLKIKWNPSIGSYDQAELERLLKRHGRISVLVISTKKKGNAMVEYEEARSAHSAIRYEKGLPSNPLSLSWVVPPVTSFLPQKQTSHTNQSTISSFPPAAGGRSVQDDLDFEKMVLEKMRAKAKQQKDEDAEASTT